MYEINNISLLNNFPHGYVLFRLSDYNNDENNLSFISCNNQFLDISKLTQEQLKTRKGHEILSSLFNNLHYWYQLFILIAQQKHKSIINSPIQIYGQHYFMNVYSPENNYFLIYFQKSNQLIDADLELANFFDINLDLLCIADLNGNFLRVNKSWESTLGYTSSYLLKHKFFDFIHPDDLDKTNQAVKQLTNNETVTSFINRYRTITGDYRFIEWRSNTINDHIFAAARDITERFVFEGKQAYELEKFNRIFDNNLTLISLSSFQSLTFVEVNSALINFLRKDKASLIGQKNIVLDQIFTYKDDTDTLANLIIKHKTVKDIQIDFTKYFGNPSYGLLSGELYIARGQKFFLTFMIDITEQKIYQNKLQYYYQLQSILREFSTNFINIQTVNVAEAVNKILAEIGTFFNGDRAYIFEYNYDKKVITNLYNWCREDINAPYNNLEDIPFAQIPEWVDNHQHHKSIIINNILDYQYPKTKKELISHHIKSIMTIPIFNDNKCIGFAGVDFVRQYKQFSDMEVELLEFFVQIYANIIARIKSEKNLAKTNALLLKKSKDAENYAQKAFLASKAKSQFLANMSHEIRTPLNSVLGFSELLLTTDLSQTQTEYALNTNNSAKSLLEIINDILDFSKIEAGKLELDIIKTDIFNIIEKTEDIIKFNSFQKGLDLLIDISPSLPKYVYVDPTRLKQVLVNLLSNAVKFTDKGEVNLKVDFVKKNTNKGLLSFEVTDTGIGISENQKSKLFKAFSQADESTNRKFGGTGLGLVISNNIVSMMGGSINFTSKVHEGSKFYFSIPTEFQDSSKFDKSSIPNINKILCVDTNKNRLKIFNRLLTSWGILSTQAVGANEALKILKSGKSFDVIIINHNMKGISGIELIASIREDLSLPQQLQPIILLHNPNDNKIINHYSEELQLSLSLTKPLNHSKLFYLLNKIEDRIYFQRKEIQEQEKRDSEIIELSYNPKILIAEDNNLNMKLIEIILKKIIPNVQIHKVINGKEAVDAFKKNMYNLIFMDLSMPEMDGLTATKLIRNLENEDKNKIPIIALTANVVAEDKQSCLSAGMNDFLSKPINKKELSGILIKYLVGKNVFNNK